MKLYGAVLADLFILLFVIFAMITAFMPPIVSTQSEVELPIDLASTSAEGDPQEEACCYKIITLTYAVQDGKQLIEVASDGDTFTTSDNDAALERVGREAPQELRLKVDGAVPSKFMLTVMSFAAERNIPIRNVFSKKELSR